MPRYKRPASDAGRVGETVPGERCEKTFPNSSLDFFQMGHRALVGGVKGSGLSICRITGEGQRQLGPKIWVYVSEGCT
jgi:hypothetical protein